MIAWWLGIVFLWVGTVAGWALAAFCAASSRQDMCIDCQYRRAEEGDMK